jgi:drug/metabolite transporter (DMT)-like permease
MDGNDNQFSDKANNLIKMISKTHISDKSLNKFKKLNYSNSAKKSNQNSKKSMNDFSPRVLDFRKDNIISTTNYNNDSSKLSVSKIYSIKSRYLLIVSVLFLSLSLLFIKILFHSHNQISHSHNSLNFFCGVSLLIYSIIFINIDNIDLSIKRNFNKGEIDYLMIRGILGYLSIQFTVCALENMRLLSAVSLIYLSPIITTFIILKKNREKITIRDKICLLTTMFLIFIFVLQDYHYGHEDEENNFADSFKGIIFSLTAAMIYSINNITDQKVCYEFHSYIILFVIGSFSVVLSPIFMVIQQDKFNMTAKNFTLFLLFGTSSFFGFYFNNKTIEANNLLINSSLHNITILLSYIYSIFIFDEPFTLYDILASGLIMIINCYMKLRAEESEDNDN